MLLIFKPMCDFYGWDASKMMNNFYKKINKMLVNFTLVMIGPGAMQLNLIP